jgi:nitrogen fixation protein
MSKNIQQPTSNIEHPMAAVAQVCHLPYRRFEIGGTLTVRNGWRVANPRYSRLQSCATVLTGFALVVGCFAFPL